MDIPLSYFGDPNHAMFQSFRENLQNNNPIDRFLRTNSTPRAPPSRPITHLNQGNEFSTPNAKFKHEHNNVSINDLSSSFNDQLNEIEDGEGENEEGKREISSHSSLIDDSVVFSSQLDQASISDPNAQTMEGVPTATTVDDASSTPKVDDIVKEALQVITSK